MKQHILKELMLGIKELEKLRQQLERIAFDEEGEMRKPVFKLADKNFKFPKKFYKANITGGIA